MGRSKSPDAGRPYGIAKSGSYKEQKIGMLQGVGGEVATGASQKMRRCSLLLCITVAAISSIDMVVMLR
jgi:hypothetical protein